MSDGNLNEDWKMSLFLSSYENRLDNKGRISVPASFRAALTSDKFAGVVLLYRRYVYGAHGTNGRCNR